MLGRRLPASRAPLALRAPQLPASRPEIKKTAFLLMGVFFTLIS